ncbi:glycosyltransferase [Salinibacterium sp. G-O1]|uniref:glycosyltransferase n=1 Tax=Salinibacterium sp. G-O1 TaxID=3046208 RepID=UPI0024B9AD7D|nr:glycosyltransferase [Salinibacterium sp. G-O1]MDJ0336523.1 glycosyltransferase [Salinibacterium sp. G-O1]
MIRLEWLAARLETLSVSLGGAAGAQNKKTLAAAIDSAGERGAYLARAVLSGRIPLEGEVRETRSEFAADSVSALDALVAATRAAHRFQRPARVVLESGLVVDVTDTSQSEFTTGIQRVARELVGASVRLGRNPRLVSWNTHTGELFSVTGDAAVRGGAPGLRDAERHLVVPDGAQLLLPEIAVDRDRAQRLASLALFGAERSVAVGFDCIPITTAETAGPGMPGAFSRYLAGISRFSAVVAISGAAQTEFTGWSQMLPSAGVSAPAIDRVDLPITPIDVEPATPGALVQAHSLGECPVVLSVGSHEPRKNHLIVLWAAEILWREGVDFTLVFVGGNSWRSEEFTELVARLQQQGRHIRLVSNAPDATVAGLYAIATVSVFCSVNEGYGLPVAESLAMGTPVVTANFGSQRDIGEDRGAILVDPRDPHAIAASIRTVLLDGDRRDELIQQSRNIEKTSWTSYSEQVLDRLNSR